MKITSVIARQILDSRGNPTVEADVTLEDGSFGRSAVPSGASTGSNEAIELRDSDKSHYNGKGVLKAVDNVNTEIADALKNKDITDQKDLDQTLIDLDGTDNKGRLGANAILAVSMAFSAAMAKSQNKPLFEYFASLATKKAEQYILPTPMMNIINGGKHAAGSTDIQEFMIMPVGAPSFPEAIRMGAEVFHALAKVLTENGYGTTVGDEGGYAPHVKNGNKEALDLIAQAVEKAGYKLGEDIMLALDIAATELFQDGKYHLATENRDLTPDEMVAYLKDLTEKYPIISIEDGLAEDDWATWQKLTAAIGDKVQLVGDDIFVTNTQFLERGIQEKSANAILVKVNQIGTITETVAAVEMATNSGWKAIISHRSGETEDTTIAHLVTGLATGQIKTGSLSRTDRVAKYNELIRIGELLPEGGKYLGKEAI